MISFLNSTNNYSYYYGIVAEAGVAMVIFVREPVRECAWDRTDDRPQWVAWVTLTLL